MKNIVIMIGAPGSGKGTQAKLAAQRHQFLHISSGDLLRSLAIKKKLNASEKKAVNLMRQGKLVPDRIIFGLVFERIIFGLKITMA